MALFIILIEHSYDVKQIIIKDTDIENATNLIKAVDENGILEITKINSAYVLIERKKENYNRRYY